jgi:hypothetical protein
MSSIPHQGAQFKFHIRTMFDLMKTYGALLIIVCILHIVYEWTPKVEKGFNFKKWSVLNLQLTFFTFPNLDFIPG